MQVTQTLRKAAQVGSDRPLTIFGNRTRTAGEVIERVRRAGAALTELGVAPGDRVGILALNSDRYFELLFATPWAGAVVNPVNVRWSVEEIGYSLVDCDTRVLFVDDTFAPMVDARRRRAPDLGAVVFIGENDPPVGVLTYEALIAEANPVDGRRPFRRRPLRRLLHRRHHRLCPRASMLSHDNLLVSAMGTDGSGDVMTPDGRFLHAAPMFHLADLAAWSARDARGRTHVIVPMFTPAGVATAIAEHQVTDTLLVPTMIQMLVDSPETAEADMSSLRRILYGASPILRGSPRPSREGPARTRPHAGIRHDRALAGRHAPAPARTTTSTAAARAAGRAAPHARCASSTRTDNEVPRGTVGEIVARGDHVMLGYWNKPEETAAALRGGWMHTGDGGYMDEDGYLFVVDRIKDMIVTGGENVYSAEVENALAKHPAVASCAVIGVPDEEWGERVHAVVVLPPGADPADELSSASTVRSCIAGYKAAAQRRVRATPCRCRAPARSSSGSFGPPTRRT